jgi:hypothetical protein
VKTIAIVRLGLFAAPLWAPVPIGIAATVTVDCDSGESVSSALARLDRLSR